MIVLRDGGYEIIAVLISGVEVLELMIIRGQSAFLMATESAFFLTVHYITFDVLKLQINTCP